MVPALARSPQSVPMTLALVLSIALPASGSATANTAADTPEIVDAEGDANGVSSTSGVPLPVSVGFQDLHSIWFDTAYYKEVERGPDGEPLAIHYLPYGIHVVTYLAEPFPDQLPPPDGTVTFRAEYRLFFGTDRCAMSVVTVVSREAMDEPPKVAAHILAPGCPGGDGLRGVNSGKLLAEFVGSSLALTVPFAAFLGPNQGVLQAGRTIVPRADGPSADAVWHPPGSSTRVAVDHVVGGRTFVIGSDLPPDVDCVEDPGHHDCKLFGG